MKIKLDENLPDVLAGSLENLGRNDRVVWEVAQAESRFLITQDLDFSDIHKFAPGTHAGILLVRLHAPSRQNIIAALEYIFRTENVEQWSGCFVIATERKTRVIRP